MLKGGQGNDLSDGGESDDIIIGNQGDDYRVGPAGNDVIRGRAGIDVLIGNAGNDILIGDSCADFLISSEGGDQFILRGDTFTNGAAASRSHSRLQPQRRRHHQNCLLQRHSRHRWNQFRCRWSQQRRHWRYCYPLFLRWRCGCYHEYRPLKNQHQKLNLHGRASRHKSQQHQIALLIVNSKRLAAIAASRLCCRFYWRFACNCFYTIGATIKSKTVLDPTVRLQSTCRMPRTELGTDYRGFGIVEHITLFDTCVQDYKNLV